MAQSVSQILLHVVFSTRNRENLIPPDLEKELYAYMASVCRNRKSLAYRIGGTENHVHIACTLARTLTVADLLEDIKKTSSAWIKMRDSRCTKFAWQSGYGAFSLGQSQLPTLIAYIENQHQHHRKRDFKAEFLELLQRYGIDCDERYLWD